MKVLALDVGYGDTKAYDGTNFFKFPSAIAPYSFLGGQNNTDDGLYKEKKYTFEGNDYLVGEMALNDENCKTTRSQEFIQEYTPIFLYRAMQKVGEPVDVVGVGIPLSDFVSDGAEKFKNRYTRRLNKFIINDKVIEIPTVDIFAQGHGIYIDYIAKEGKTEEEETVLVVDIGFNTIDILSVVKGVPTRKDSTTLTGKGVVKIINDLREYLKNTYSFDLSEQAAKDVLNKRKIKLYGDTKDLSDIIEKISSNYAKWFFEEIRSSKDAFLQKADRFVIAGGGAYFVRHLVPDEYKRLTFVPLSPEYANVRGYYLLSMSRLQSQSHS